MIPKTVGLIVFEQMAADELTGPAEAFSQAKMPTGDGREFRCYHIITLGISTESCVTECGVIIKPQLDINDAPPLDTVMIPGGSGIHNLRLSKKIAEWLSRRAPAMRRMATLGAGIYPLAATGCSIGARSQLTAASPGMYLCDSRASVLIPIVYLLKMGGFTLQRGQWPPSTYRFL